MERFLGEVTLGLDLEFGLVRREDEGNRLELVMMEPLLGLGLWMQTSKVLACLLALVGR